MKGLSVQWFSGLRGFRVYSFSVVRLTLIFFERRLVWVYRALRPYRDVSG